MKTTVFVLAAALALGAPVAASADIVPVTQLTGTFAATNSSVTKTPDGVHFGVYADAGRTGGSLLYTGANGLTLGQITALGYTYQYNTSNDVGIAAPYLRVFLDTNGDGTEDSDVIFDPTHCATVTPDENVDHTVDVVAGNVRFNDDACAGAAPEQPFSAVRAANTGAVVTGIFVTQGFSGGLDASALVRDLTVNGDTFVFDAPGAGPTGPTGPAGPAGPTGAAGTTTIVQVPVPVPAAAGGVAGQRFTQACRGATVRRIHAPRRRGERFVRVNAALQSPSGLRRLPARGRTITVDLRNRPEGNYNVRLISRYRTRSGKVRRVVTRRNLSVACS